MADDKQNKEAMKEAIGFTVFVWIYAGWFCIGLWCLMAFVRDLSLALK